MQQNELTTRRHWLQQTGCGFGMLGLAGLMHSEGLLESSATAATSRALNPMAPLKPHFPARAQRVIWLYINGGPSHVDTWDYKPTLAKMDGKSIKEFDSTFKDTTGFFKNSVGNLMKSPFQFKPRGECGKMVSEIFPQLGAHVDKMAFIHSGFATSNNHSPALFMMNTGRTQMGYPCVGSWVMYGLGSESQNLPGFVVMSDPKGRGLPKGSAANWGAAYLPGAYQGTHLRPKGAPIDNLLRPTTMTDPQQREQIDFIQQLNRFHQSEHKAEAALAARIESFELAYRMQTAAPEALDISKETKETLKMYGMEDDRCAHFARQCLMARRLIERDVRFIQIYSGGMENQRSWDGHIDIKGNHSQFAGETDQPIAALLTDLEQRGLLKETLLIWCGEFGRLPIAQTGKKPGRDHNPHCFTAWMAGGIKGGTTYGASDDIGYKAAEKKVHVHDLHATLLHMLGLDHKKLTFMRNGLRTRLTGVGEDGNVLKDIIA